MTTGNEWFKVTTVAEQLARARSGARTEWLAEGVFVKSGSTLLYAPPASAKSLVAMDLALAATEGRLWMGAHGFGEPIPTVYVDDDGNNENEFNSRLLAFQAREDNLHLHLLLHRGFKLTEDPKRQALLDYCRDHSVGLLILDSLTRLHNLSETSSDDMKRISAAIKEFCQAGVTVLVLHHTTKRGTTFRGSSEIAAGFDGVLRLDKLGDNSFLLTNEKVRSVGTAGVWKGCRIVIGQDEDGRLMLDGTATLGGERPTDAQVTLRARILELLGDGEMHGTALKRALKLSSRDYPLFEIAIEWLLAEQIITARKEGKATVYSRAEDAEGTGGLGDLIG